MTISSPTVIINYLPNWMASYTTILYVHV